MKNSIPIGFTKIQWTAVTQGLKEESGTINDYRKVINLLARYHQIDQITRKEAEAYFDMLDQQVKEGLLSANTAHRYKATLRSIASRMEKHPELWSSYENPFRGLLGEEERAKTAYNENSFASAEDLNKIISLLPKLPLEEQITLRFMLYAGLLPNQIQQLRTSSFSYGSGQQLEMKADLGTFQEYTDLPWRQSVLYQSGLPLSYVSRSRSHTITWRYQGTFVFHKDMEDLLLRYYTGTGQSTDARAYLMTKRHHPYSYRSIHRIVSLACQQAGLQAGRITPRQLSLHGIVYSWLALHMNIKNDTGVWKDQYPVPLQKQMDEILKQFSEDELLHLIAA